MNPFSAGLDKWEHPLEKREQTPAVAPIGGAVRTRGPAPDVSVKSAPDTQTTSEGSPIEGFTHGLEEWEHPLHGRG